MQSDESTQGAAAVAGDAEANAEYSVEASGTLAPPPPETFPDVLREENERVREQGEMPEETVASDDDDADVEGDPGGSPAESDKGAASGGSGTSSTSGAPSTSSTSSGPSGSQGGSAR